MLRRAQVERITMVLPWLCVVAFAGWATAPLVTAEDQVFAGRLSTDNVVTPWFYDLVARLLAEGRDTDWLWGLRHPAPLARSIEFPSDWDARLVAPLSWLADWPRSWGLVQAAALLVNGLGAAILARGLGARGVGVVVAGVLGVVCRPVWKDLVMARMNAAFPGLALGALGAWLLVIEVRGRRWGVATAALAVALGVAASLVYPPFVALLVPLGVVFGLEPVWRARWRSHGGGRTKALLVVVGVAAVVWPLLDEITSAGLSRTVACRDLVCPSQYNAVTWDRVFMQAPDHIDGLSASGSAAAGLMLWPTVVLWRRRRAALAASLVVGTLLFLALGPCARWSAGERIDLAALPFGWQPWAFWASCQLEPLHDYNRLLTLGVLVAGVLGGVGVEAAAGRRWGLRRVAVLGVAAMVVGHAQWLVLSESMAPTKWHAVPVPATARHISSLDPDQQGPVAELPFDRSAQFLSALAEPSVPRANPLRPNDPPPRPDRFWTWLYAAGKGRPLPDEPTAVEVSHSGLRWVYFDADRCANAANDACSTRTQASLRRVLGVPERVGGLLVWDLRGGR